MSTDNDWHVIDTTRVYPKASSKAYTLSRDNMEHLCGGLKYDDDKLRYDLLDPAFTDGVVEVLTYGAKKYADNSWQELDNFENRYYAALMRHISAWRQGEANDQESGIHHLKHAACNLYFLLSKDQCEKTTEDK